VIVGVGIDIVGLEEFRARLSDALVQEIFLPDEIAYAASRARPWESYAARFAAKEAAMKALGAGLSQGVAWRDIEVLRGVSGDLSLRLAGRALDLARGKGVTRSWVSVAHSGAAAAAVVVLEA
jgi:holo-[acyl-carrier protein] synthase